MSPPQILIVEDKAIIAKDIQATVEEAGYDVPATASRGETAVKLAAELQPNLILMDIRLKGEMDGIEAAQRIRELHDIPIVFLTAHADEETLQRAVSTEPFGYVIKPFEARELEVAIEISLYKHRVENKLKEQEKWLAATLESIGDAVLTTDPQGKIIYLNPVAQKLTGWEQAVACGKNVDDVIVMVDEQSHTHVTNPLKRALRLGITARLESPVLLIAADGREILVDDVATPIRDETGQLIGGVIVLRDVQMMQELRDQLRQSQKLEALGQLTAGMAHNFNNMLTVINLYNSMVRSSLPADDPNRKRLDVIEESTKRATDMIQHLLAFARNQVFQPKLLALNEAVTKTHKILREVLPEMIELRTRLQADEDWVQIDLGQFEQVLMNLVINARDAMPKGGEITIGTKNIELDRPLLGSPSGVPAGSYVQLYVSDSGVGMTRETMSRIFDPFFTTKEEGQGTGLGLSTCLGIVEQNGGRIIVDSRPGRGTVFRIYLPLQEPAAAAAAESDDNATLEGKETILVVEDDAQIREAISQSLQEYGYTVLVAKNGINALRLLETKVKTPIQLLITDMMMPEMGGQPLANILRSVFNDLKVLFISGYPDASQIPIGVAFLPKPFTPDRLAQKVREMLTTD